ncbi:Hypothetical predicted protein [Octopus vulgaris]|uniref:Uncharacterized protein n=1 Tax=Octopus vulgaris TaxID=6645 RepID=A0AA36AWZ9_OCTVU|nr:Hypothetical predicted protein [Octopus vulgaris]
MDVHMITAAEIKPAMDKMESGKATGNDNITFELISANYKVNQQARKWEVVNQRREGRPSPPPAYFHQGSSPSIHCQERNSHLYHNDNDVEDDGDFDKGGGGGGGAGGGAGGGCSYDDDYDMLSNKINKDDTDTQVKQNL